MVMREHEIPIDEIYVPMKRRQTVDPQRVTALAEDILANGQQNPIWVRRDDKRYVLVEGAVSHLTRLACARHPLPWREKGKRPR